MINHKKTVLALVLCTIFYHSKAISPPLRSDSIINCTSSSDSIDRLALDTEELLQRKKGNETNKRAGWFSDFFDALTSPFRPVWGAYEGGYNTAPGQTTFNREEGVMQQVQKIQNIIRNSNPNEYFKEKSIYSTIFSYANTAHSGCGGNDEEICINARTAKNAAFVALIGLDDNGDSLTLNDRIMLRHRAVDILKDCYLWTLYSRYYWKNHQWRSKELICYLQALDYLRIIKHYDAHLTVSDEDLDDIKDELQDFTEALHGRANNFLSSYDRFNNYSIMTGAAVAMAGIVLHNQTTYFWNNEAKPDRWVNSGNFYLDRTMWRGPGTLSAGGGGAMSTSGSINSYAEGPGYFEHGFENALPFFIAVDNDFNGSPVTRNYSSQTFFAADEDVPNYLYDSDYENMVKWYNSIRLPNNNAPTYDDTRVRKLFAAIGIARFKSGVNHNIFTEANFPFSYLDDGNYSLHIDFLVAQVKWVIEPQKRDIIIPNSESVIITNGSGPLKDQHYLHFLHESGTAKNGYRWFNQGHEHGDGLSFTIAAGEDILIDDPAYISWGDRELTNESSYHNVIVVDGEALDPDQSAFLTKSQLYKSGAMLEGKATYRDWGGELADIKRRIEVMKESNVYYVINDRAESKNWVFDQEQEFRINGNGMSDGDENSFSFLSGNQTARWFHPCSKDGNNNDNWGVQATIISNKGTTPHNSLGHKHGNKAYEITAGQGSAHQVTKMVPSLSDRGEHGRFNIKFTAAAGDVNRFMAVIMPYKCNGSVPAIPIFHQSSDYISQLISLNGLSPAQNLHITKTDKTSHTNISNPFGLSGSSAVMDVKAEHAFMSYGLTHIFEMGSNCIAYTNFRKARVAGGSYLKYNDTVFISSNQEVEAHYELTGIFAYEGYCITGGSTSVVDFFLPDLEQGIIMVAKGNISSYSYDTNTFIMTVVFPANTTTNFRFEMADPCKINCFYPDTNNHITNTFVQAGRDEYMPYKLKILQPNGQLIMADGAKMHICEFKWLNNRDSLIMVGKEGNYEGLPLTCQKNVIAERALNLDNGRTAIIVGNNASLVLDSGSYTRVGANSSIYVLPGGTLIVKPHAVLEIGSDDAEGYGEVLADRGANVCVSPGAIIKFHRNDLDSTDKNRFYVYINDFTQPTALNKTEPAISSAIEQMLYNDTLINAPGNNNCQPFYNFNTILPPHGIINRDWGYAPFVVPRATFKVAGDTLCPGDSVVINLRKVLNESGYRFSVCRVQDTLKTTPCLLGDTNAILKDYIQLSDGCSEKMLIPEELKFLLWDSGWYRIKVEVINECGITHDTTKYVYVPAPPDIVINMPDSICPGVGTLIADGSQTQSYRTRAIYKWTALLVVPDSIRMQEKGIDYGGDWREFDSTAVTNSFNFPDFRFYGGFKYAIGLSVKGWCGWVTKWDTVNVPLAAYIKSRLATNYQNPIGPSAFELKGYVTGATSYAWSPTTYLDEPDSLTTIARPDQPITYILSATDGGVCYDYDTMHVAHNEVAYAGENALLCFNEKQILGTGYNAFTMLALMAYFNEAEFDAIYPDAFTPTQYYFNRFMLDNISGFYFNKLANDTALQRYFLTNSQIASVMQNCFESNYQADAFSNEIKKMIAQDRWLAAHLVSNNYLQIQSVVAPILSDFAGWMQNNILGYPIAIAGSKLAIPIHPASIEIVWETLQDNSWVEIPAYRNSYNMLQTHAKGGEYRITVLNPSTNSVEYDQVSVIKDTTINVAFMPSFMIDSTVWFTNVSAPVNNRTIYNWYFGDGSHSNLKHPNHTFPSKDSTYIICLTATNECDSFTYCDTLTLDSNGMFFTFGKKGNDPIVLQEKPTDVIKQLSYHRAMNKLSVNQPNPFSDKTTIEYQLMEGYGEAEIRISNTLGQAIKTIKLKGNRGFTTIDGSQWRAGLYHYSLIIDGMIIDSKVMAVGR